MQNMTLLTILSGCGILGALVLLGNFLYLLVGRSKLINRIILNYIYAGMASCMLYGLLHNILSHPDFFNALVRFDFSAPRIQAYLITWAYRATIYFSIFAIWLRILLQRARRNGKKKEIFRMLYIHAALIATAWLTDFEKLIYYGGSVDLHHITHWIGGVIGCSMLILLEYVFMEKKIIKFLGIEENFQHIRSKWLFTTIGMSILLLLGIFGIVIGCIGRDPGELLIGKMIVYAFLLLIPLLMIILRITDDFQKNLHNAVSALNSAARQDFTYKVNIDSKNEFGELAVSLEELKTSFQNVISKVKAAGAEVSESARTINTTLSEFILNLSQFFTRQSEITGGQIKDALQAQKDVIKIENTISDITGELGHQSQLINTTSDLFRKMETSIKGITGQTKSADLQADALFSIAEEGKTSILTTLDSIRNVEQKSDRIQTLSDIISDISEKTKLLAINTSIEAANLGAQGSGFKVLAQELRNLAENSAANTDTIIGNLSEINQSIRESLERTEISRQGFMDIHSQAENSRQLNKKIHTAMRDENSLLAEITNVSNRLVAITGTIAEFSAQLLEGSSLIHQVFKNFQSRATEDEQTFKDNSSRLQELIELMKKYMQQNLEISVELDTVISGFII